MSTSLPIGLGLGGGWDGMGLSYGGAGIEIGISLGGLQPGICPELKSGFRDLELEFRVARPGVRRAWQSNGAMGGAREG